MSLDSELSKGHPKSIYFGGCAWGSALYVGAYKAMVKRWGSEFWKDCLITGDSAGCIFAVGMAIGRTPEQMESLYSTICELSVKHGAFGKCGQFTENCFREVLQNYPNAYKDIQGRCWIGTTSFPCTHHWHKEWNSNDDLIRCMRVSLHIPFYCHAGRVKIYHERQLGFRLDGAYSLAGSDLPHLDETMYIGVDPNAEITRAYTTSQMLNPPTPSEYDEYSECGYNAIMNWNGEYLQKVGKRRQNFEAMPMLWVLKSFELLKDAVHDVAVRPVVWVARKSVNAVQTYNINPFKREYREIQTDSSTVELVVERSSSSI